MNDNTAWNDVKDVLPPCNTIVKVRLTNGCESFDFVNEPINVEMPFQHYIAAKWRPVRPDELNSLLWRWYNYSKE